MGRAGRGAGEPGPASGVATPRAQRGSGRGGRPPLPKRRLSRPAAPRLRHFKKEGLGTRERRMRRDELVGRGESGISWREGTD